MADRDCQRKSEPNSHPAGERQLLPSIHLPADLYDSCLVAVHFVGLVCPRLGDQPCFSGNGAEVAHVPHEHETAGGGTRSRYGPHVTAPWMGRPRRPVTIFDK